MAQETLRILTIRVLLPDVADLSTIPSVAMLLTVALGSRFLVSIVWLGIAETLLTACWLTAMTIYVAPSQLVPAMTMCIASVVSVCLRRRVQLFEVARDYDPRCIEKTVSLCVSGTLIVLFTVSALNPSLVSRSPD